MSETHRDDSTREPATETERERPEAPPRVTGPETGRRVAVGVGTFVVTGVGFVLTLFFVSQFASTDAAGGFAGSLLGGVGVVAGFVFALLLSPLVAVLVGLTIGRSSGDRVALDAGIASAVGFVVMFFVCLLLAAALGGTAAGAGTSLVQAGPLFGFAIGIALTGAAAAKVTALDGSVFAEVTGMSLARPAGLGLSLYVVFGLGYAVSVFLAATLSGADSGLGLNTLGTGGVVAALGIGVVVTPLVAVVVGRVVAADVPDGDSTEAAVAGGVSSAVGVLGMLVVLYLAVLVLQPGGSPAGEFPLGPLLGFVVGTGLTGAGSAAIANRD